MQIQTWMELSKRKAILTKSEFKLNLQALMQTKLEGNIKVQS